MSKFFIALLLIFSLYVAAGAEEIPVNIKSDRLKYIEGTGLIEASGSVEVTIKGVTIHSDILRLDSASNIATAEGHVKMFTKEYTAAADLIVYDATREVSEFTDFQTVVASGKVKGELRLSAAGIKELEDKMLGSAGVMTTCGDDVPHYYVVAEKVEYYPKDRIIGYNVVMYVGELPVLWTPYLYYDLSNKQQRNWTIGHNDVEGDYFKSSWGYPYGTLYLDLMEKKGFGHGTETPYGLLGWGSGVFYLYHLDEKDTGITDWITRVSHSAQLDPWTTLKLNHRLTATYLIPSGRKDETAMDIDLNYARDKARWNLKLSNFDDRLAALNKNSLSLRQSEERVTTQYDLNYDYSKSSPEWLRSSQRLYHQRPLWRDNVLLTTRTNYYNSVADRGQPGDERLEPSFDITGREPGYSWRYSQNWYIDLDGDTYTDDGSYQYLEKQPEVEVSPNPVDLRLFTLRPTFGYGRYHEVRYAAALGANRDYTSERYQATLNANRSLPLGWGTLALLGMGVDQFVYAPGDQMYAYRESLSLRTNLGGFFRNDIDYKKGRTDGNTPFFFDKLGANYHNVRERLTFYYQNKFKWDIEGGHNWQAHQWFDVNTGLLVRPDEKLYWTARTGWDIENRRYKDLVNNLTLVPYSYYSVRFSAVSDMNLGEVRSGSIQHGLYLLEGQPNQWYIKLGQIYDRPSGQFKVRDIMAVKDLHCWELKFTYSDYRKEFSLTFKLKALPDEPLGMSSGRGFYFDAFEKELNDLKPEGAVKRY